MNLQSAKIRNLQKHGSVLLFILILLFSFVLLNMAAGLMFADSKLDLTKDKRYTFSPETVQILENLTQPININIYYSPSIYKEYPLYAQYVQFVLRTLDRYRNLSDNKIKINIFNPEPYSSVEEDAKRYQLRKFSASENENGYYFGAVMTNAEGKKYVIPYFQSLRQNYLENDLTRGIASLSGFKRRNVGIMSPDLPILDTTYRGKQADKDWTFVKLLRHDYNIYEISENTPQIPLDINTLIVVSTRKFSSVGLYAIDQFLLRGGNLLVMVDPFSEYEDKLKGITEIEGSDLNLLLKNWGISYEESLVSGDRRLSEEITFSDGSVRKYYPWINLGAEQASLAEPVTRNLTAISFKTPGSLKLTPVENVETVPLLKTTEQSLTIDAKIAKFGDKLEVVNFMKENGKPLTLAALSKGSYHSIFDSNPLADSDIAEEMLPFINTSVTPGKIIVVADSDWIYQQNWVATGFLTGGKVDEIVSFNNNYDFLLRSVDYLSGNGNAMAVGNKEIADRADTLRRRIEKITAAEYASRFEELRKDFEQQKLTLNTTLQLIKNQEISPSVKVYNEIQEMQRSLQKKEEEMRRMEYKIKQESETAINGIISVNVLIFPLLVLFVAWLAAFLIQRRTQNRAERLLHE
jgi:hypothetical protein